MTKNIIQKNKEIKLGKPGKEGVEEESDDKNTSVKVKDSEENRVFLHSKERAKDFPRYQREERNEDIQQISRMSEQMHISNIQPSQMHLSNPHHSQYNQKITEKERPRQTGPKAQGNVDTNRDCEEQRAHAEYVRLYIRCEMPRTAGPHNQPTIDDLVMLTPKPHMITQRDQRFTHRGQLFTPRTPREPLIRQPDVAVPTNPMGIQKPCGLIVQDQQLLPKIPTNQLLKKDIHSGEKQRTLEEQQMRNKEKEKEPEEPHYEEIPDKMDDNVEQQSPKSEPTNTFPFRQKTPPSVVVNCSPDTLPKAFINSAMARPPFSFQEQVPRQDPLQETIPWQEGDELGAVGGLGWSKEDQIKEVKIENWEKQVQKEELNEGTWENEHNEDSLEWDDMEFNWEEQLWQPRVQSAEEEQRELKKLIDKEVLIVHDLEKRINRSEALENIYNHENFKCSLLYEGHIATATTDPNYLHDNPKERIRMMKDIYEEIQLAKEMRLRALENMADMDKVRKSKRLSMKPRKRYK